MGKTVMGKKNLKWFPVCFLRTVRGRAMTLDSCPRLRLATTLHNSRAARCLPRVLGSAARLAPGSSPERGSGSPRLAHPLGQSCHGAASRRAQQDSGRRGPARGSRGGAERAASRGRSAAAPTPTRRRKSHLPCRAPETAGDHGGAAGREEEGRRGAGAGGLRRGMLGPSGAPNPFLAASAPVQVGPWRATPPRSGFPSPRGDKLFP